MIDEDYDELFDRVRGNLGEHFSNYMFIVMDDDGDLFYDYANDKVGRMLIYEANKDMQSQPMEIIWVEEEEEKEDDGT
ncbi:MAG: hypothetical protein P8H35_00435 [Flavobacteriales bacterium]|jgi:hypothetical protein|nr:hypothetical protein [Flavobacteriales bacterium]